jgi:hypothetical protein
MAEPSGPPKPPSPPQVWITGILAPAFQLALYALWVSKAHRYREIYDQFAPKMSQRYFLTNIALQKGPYLWIAMGMVCAYGWILMARGRRSAALTWFRWTLSLAFALMVLLNVSLLVGLMKPNGPLSDR